MIKEINTDWAKCWIDDNGFMRIRFSVQPGSEIDLRAAKSLLEKWIKLLNGEKYPHIFDTRENFGTITFAAGKYLAQNPELKALISGKGFLVDSLANRLLINFYLRISNHRDPAMLFKTEAEAIEWLKNL